MSQNNSSIENTPNIHEVIALIDKSGSMHGKELDTIGGINSTFDVLRTENNENNENIIIKASVKLFNNDEEMLIRSQNIQDISPLTQSQYIPSGTTSLFDALGFSLQYFMEKKLMDPNSYNKCTFYIVTDGLENSSKVHNATSVKKIIENADKTYGIKVIYMGANQDAIFEASKIGINPEQAMNYSENSENVNSAFRSAGSMIRRHYTDQPVEFTNVERMASQR